MKPMKIELLFEAQQELELIARTHLSLVGPQSARKITDKIYSGIDMLSRNPNIGRIIRDKELAAMGYRMLIIGVYICIYRQIGNVVVVYHIVDGRTDYPKLFKSMQ